MTIKYIGQTERVQNRELLNKIAEAIFGTPEDINFAEEFVPPDGKTQNPKVATFVEFLTNYTNHLWGIFSDDNPKIPLGFILIADMPHPNSIGFCIKRNFARKGLMRQAWEEIRQSSQWQEIDFPLFGQTSQRNTAANQFLTNIGFKFIEETNFAGEPSNKYQYINQFNPPKEPPEEDKITIDTLQKDEVKEVITKLISNNFPILDSTERKGTEMIYGCCGDPVNDPKKNVQRIVHCDWSTNANKRWMTIATLNENTYVIDNPILVGNLNTFFNRMKNGIKENGRVLIGFDFPIGVPAAYAHQIPNFNFLHFLQNLQNAPNWGDFYNLCQNQNEICLERPFYPYRPGGTCQDHLINGLGLLNRDQLFRTCERATLNRTAASPLFWTLGAKQVGRAAISGWRDLLAPELVNQNCQIGLWPFQGNLAVLLPKYKMVIAESYPAESYIHLGFPRSGWSKRNPADRIIRGNQVIEWRNNRQNEVTFSNDLIQSIQNGFGPHPDGEDPFDSFVGILTMIDIVLGQRNEGSHYDLNLNQVEGWILGQN